MNGVQVSPAGRGGAGTRSGLLLAALQMSRDCGIAPCDVQDVGVRAMDSAVRMPAGRRWVCITSAIRRELARQLGVARRTLPDDWCGLKAVGQFEARRREYGAFRGRRWAESFDRHSRHFAVENGVCPRCARPGEFRPEAGRCECGFHYT